MPAEDLIRHRILAYHDDRRSFETRAEQISPIHAWPPVNSKEIQAAYAEYQSRHRTTAAKLKIHGYVRQPGRITTEVRFERISVRGRRANVVTLESDRNRLDGFSRYRYALVNEDGEWLLVSRGWQDPGEGTWINGLL